MATYDLTQSIPSSDILKTGDILNCPYSGAAISITLPKGTYKLECWGAQGGYSSTAAGKGGYSIGTLDTTEQILFNLYSGQAGVFNGNTTTFGGGG